MDAFAGDGKKDSFKSAAEMRPAGMSSDEDDFDDDYFSESLRSNAVQSKGSGELKVREDDIELKNLDASGKMHLFHKAADESNFELMNELIQEGISVDETKLDEWTPLMKACSHGNYEVVRYLLEHSADPNLHKELFTPLMACCISSYDSEMDKVNCLRLLIQYGACANFQDKHKSTALINASSNGMKEIVNELLNVPGINVNAQDKHGWTALFYAIKYNYKSIVSMLVNAGADVNIKSSFDGLTPFELADMKGYRHLYKILQDVNFECQPHDTCKITERKDPLHEFLNELPDQYGRGGFFTEVKNLFRAVGYEKLYDKLNINVSFPDFLLMSNNLDKLGIRTSHQRYKLALNGIHRYHLCRWNKNSLHDIKDNSDLSLHQFINFVSNIVKHLSILYATLDYIRVRILARSKSRIAENKELVIILIDSYFEIQKLNRILRNMLVKLNKVKPVADSETDFVGPEKTKGKLIDYLWIGICAITVGSAVFYYRRH